MADGIEEITADIPKLNPALTSGFLFETDIPSYASFIEHKGPLDLGSEDILKINVQGSSKMEDAVRQNSSDEAENDAEAAQYANPIEEDEQDDTNGDSDATEPAEDVESSRIPKIAQTFDGRNVFITGATGFVGKVLLEKLLRSCTGITKIYILLRNKGSKDPSTRLRTLLNSPAFNRIREEYPEAINKVVALSGDILCNRLGLSDEDLKTVRQLVSFVFHCAGVMDYKENFRNAIATNLLGTKHVLEVCYSMDNLLSLVHVSSAYAFSYLGDINDAVYIGMQRPDYYLGCLDFMTDSELECICKRDNMTSNIYHFSKALSEMFLVGNQGDVPISVVRPSLISASWREPFPGFIDTIYGSSGLLLSCASGLLWSVFAKSNLTADLVPVDVVVNTLITAAHHLVLHKPARVYVVNCTASDENLLTWKQLDTICRPLYNLYPSITNPSFPGGSFKNSRSIHQVCVLLQHWLPAYLVNLIWWLRGYRPRDFIRIAGQSSRDWVGMYPLLHTVLSHLEFATASRTSFCNYRRHVLMEELSEVEKQVFDTDPSSLEWELYLNNFVSGLRKYVKNEDDSTLEDARLKLVSQTEMWNSVRLFTVVAAGYLIRKAMAKVSLKTLGDVLKEQAAAIPSRLLSAIGRSR